MDRQERSGWNFACLASSAVLFAALTAAVLAGVSDSVDAAIRGFVSAWSSPVLTSFFLAVTRLGSVAVVFSLTALVAVGLLAAGRRAMALQLAAVMIIATFANNAVKYAVARARPEAFFGDVPASYSFASGHALYAGCFYGLVGAFLAAALPHAWQRAVVLAATAALIGAVGLSRIYLGVHYPTDVVAGFALAAFILCIGRGLFVSTR